MARNNFVFEYGEVSEDIYYDVLKREGKSTHYLRMHLFISRSPDAPALRGLRVCIYGWDAMWIKDAINQGSKVAVMGHVQRRTHNNRSIFEIVAEDIQLLYNVNWERGMETRKGLVEKGYLLPWFDDGHGLSADVYYGNLHLEHDPEFNQEPA